jgi:four helix bundle protein
MSIKSYQDLDVWQRGMDLAVCIYHLTAAFPAEERFGIVSQMRRSANSIPANIAEGWARQQLKEYMYFIRVAQGSLRELETHLILSQRCGLADSALVNPLLEEITILSKQFRALLISLSKK